MKIKSIAPKHVIIHKRKGLVWNLISKGLLLMGHPRPRYRLNSLFTLLYFRHPKGIEIEKLCEQKVWPVNCGTLTNPKLLGKCRINLTIIAF